MTSRFLRLDLIIAEAAILEIQNTSAQKSDGFAARMENLRFSIAALNPFAKPGQYDGLGADQLLSKILTDARQIEAEAAGFRKLGVSPTDYSRTDSYRTFDALRFMPTFSNLYLTNALTPEMVDAANVAGIDPQTLSAKIAEVAIASESLETLQAMQASFYEKLLPKNVVPKDNKTANMTHYQIMERDEQALLDSLKAKLAKRSLLNRVFGFMTTWDTDVLFDGVERASLRARIAKSEQYLRDLPGIEAADLAKSYVIDAELARRSEQTITSRTTQSLPIQHAGGERKLPEAPTRPTSLARGLVTTALIGVLSAAGLLGYFALATNARATMSGGANPNQNNPTSSPKTPPANATKASPTAVTSTPGGSLRNEPMTPGSGSGTTRPTGTGLGNNGIPPRQGNTNQK